MVGSFCLLMDDDHDKTTLSLLTKLGTVPVHCNYLEKKHANTTSMLSSFSCFVFLALAPAVEAAFSTMNGRHKSWRRLLASPQQDDSSSGGGENKPTSFLRRPRRYKNYFPSSVKSKEWTGRANVAMWTTSSPLRPFDCTVLAHVPCLVGSSFPMARRDECKCKGDGLLAVVVRCASIQS